MNYKTIFTITLAALMLGQFSSPCWGGPPNPTPSDGFRNTAGGTGAVVQNTTGANNTGFGYGTLNISTLGNSNTAIGSSALASNTSGSFNTASGAFALLSNNIGRLNTATGTSALQRNTNGIANTANGVSALASNGIGSGNTAIGYSALFNSFSGGNNTALGNQALFKKTAGSNNLALGTTAGFNLVTGNNNIYLGNPGAASESATIRIGTFPTHSRMFLAGVRGVATGLPNAVPVMIDGNGKLGTINSSARFKTDIKDMDDTSRRILELRPVTYHYKDSGDGGSNPLEYGLIAEEVAKIYPDLVAYGADGKVETVQYHKLPPMLVNEVKRLNTLLQTEKAKNSAQAQEIANLKQQMAVLQVQSERIETLTTRLSRIEANQALGMAAK
jgi:Chaperone of endosialidase